MIGMCVDTTSFHWTGEINVCMWDYASDMNVMRNFCMVFGAKLMRIGYGNTSDNIQLTIEMKYLKSK